MIDPELPGPTTWTLAFFLSFTLLENCVGALGELPGQVWTGNFYKCAGACSRPHWAA